METIIGLERVAAAHWRGTEEEWLGDWLLRAAEGFTGRANSALPLGDPGLPLDEALDAVTAWYRARGLPPMIVIPAALEPSSASQALDSQLAERQWATRPGPAFVMVAGLPLGDDLADSPAGDSLTMDSLTMDSLTMDSLTMDGHTGDGHTGDGHTGDGLGGDREVRVTSEPGDAWAAMYHYRGQDHLPPIARKVLTSAEDQSFVSIWSGAEVLAIARLSVADGWAGITAVEVSPACRRQGLGTAITAAACREAQRNGIRQVFLQVEVTNDPARALYERLGFRYSHRYHYRVAPVVGPDGSARGGTAS
jgi:GNAT superfamily N-acetyltransferase